MRAGAAVIGKYSSITTTEVWGDDAMAADVGVLKSLLAVT